MISEEQIEADVAILVREARPERVILFGPYAPDEATPVTDERTY